MANNENILHLPTDDTIANGFNAIVEALESNPGTTVFEGEVQDDDSVALEATYGELYEAAQKGSVVIKVYADDEVVGSSAVLAAVKQPNALVPRDDLIQVSLGYRLPPYILDCAGTPDETVSIPSAEVFEIQPKLTFDITPTTNSTNPVTSGGIKEYVDTHSGSATYFELSTQDAQTFTSTTTFQELLTALADSPIILRIKYNDVVIGYAQVMYCLQNPNDNSIVYIVNWGGQPKNISGDPTDTIGFSFT